MAIVRYRPGATPATLSADEIARLDAMTPADIERNAETDPDNPPMTDRELAAAVAARAARRRKSARGR
jgi:putative transcriptional regulator